MLVPPFVQLRFRIWQRTGVDPQITFGWLSKGTKRLGARWDILLTAIVACGLGWYSNNEPASVTTLFLPIALLGLALIVVGVFRRETIKD